LLAYLPSITYRASRWSGRPSRAAEGPGGNEQHVLAYLLKKGAPTGSDGQTRHKIAA
jgi:hypothetical protein